MKRLHVHVAVGDIARSVRFYSTLFAREPDVLKDDYAKWLLDDPRVNFAISSRSAKTGLDHLGIQVENGDELHDVYGRLEAAEGDVLEQGATTCCYAQSEKSWIADPEGIYWETFHTTGEATVYGDSRPAEGNAVASTEQSACCTPELKKPKLPPAAACCGPSSD